MLEQKSKAVARPRAFMSRLASDVRGNTLAMMAAFLFPLVGLVGSAVDVSRLYLVKTRLQQACDAGVLAGRKFMIDSGTTLDSNAATQAQAYFGNNFKKDVTSTGAKGFMNTDTVTFTPTRTSDNQVSATASAAVPMTITKIFGTSSITVSTTCQAKFDVADTDVMFVLDTTGSMSCLPSDDDTTCSNYAGSATKVAYTRPSGSGVTGYAGTIGVGTTEKTGSRIAAVRAAVLNFYDTFAANADPTTKIRYGFVTYSSSVNVGQAILDKSASYMVGGSGSETQNYQSRRVYSDSTSVSGTVTNSNNGKTQANCTVTAANGVRTPSTALTYSSSTGTATLAYDSWSSSTLKCRTLTDTLVPKWQYTQVAFDVSSLVSGNTITDPSKVKGETTSWQGCIESKVDSPGTSTFSVTSLPSELDPDLIPSGATRWWPHLQDLEYYRSATPDYSNNDDTQNRPNYGVDAQANVTNASYPATYMRNNGAVACGKPAKRLGVMTRAEVSAYVNAVDFVPMGGTYHDIGMIWGTRLISPNGPWASDTAAWPGRNTPNRVIVFLTDGDMAPTSSAYSMYGVEAFDKRVAGTSSTSLTTLHNARFLAECSAAKARNISVWTISIDTAANTQLTSCASTTAQALASTTGTGLSTAFATIAQRLAMLRLTQ